MAFHTHIIKQEEGQTEESVQIRASDPGSPSANQLWLNTTTKQIKFGASSSVVSGSGGGGGLLWTTESSSSTVPPTIAFENGQEVFKYDAGDTQIAETAIKVPGSYSAGSQIKMKASFYSPSASNTVLLTAKAYLIRTGIDAITSTTNFRISTNTAITNTLANKLQEVVFDLSSSSGQINAVAISAGDYIRVQVYRGSDSDTADVAFIPSATEVTFT